MTQFDTHDPRQMAALLVFMEYGPDEIVKTLVTKYRMEHNAAVNLVHDLLQTRLDYNDEPSPEIVRERLAAVAAEWDISKSMHGGST